MQGMKRLAFAPVMRLWLASQRYTNQTTPRPTDAPYARAGGADSHRVLIFGSGAALGWGVISHEIALPGSLARALSSRTGRGSEIEVVAAMRINAGNAGSALRHVQSARFDAIVVALGPNDALALTALRRWKSGMSGVLALLDRQTAPHARIIVTSVPPIRSLPGFATRLGAVAQVHAAQMNRTTEYLCRTAPRATFVGLSAARDLPPGVRADGRTYRSWANEIADALAPQLEAVDERLKNTGAGDDGSGEHDGTGIRAPLS